MVQKEETGQIAGSINTKKNLVIKVEVSCYEGSLKVETLIDWIRELKRYFKYEDAHDPNRVRFL